ACRIRGNVDPSRRRRDRRRESRGPGQPRSRHSRRSVPTRRRHIDRAREGRVMAVDLRLYALLDPAQSGGHSMAELANYVARGATLVQLRDKHGTTREMIERARSIKSALPPDVPLLINDRVDVALAAEADGVHVGWDDMDVAEARLLLGKQAIIGLSLKTVAQAHAAPIEQLDYVAIGGVFTARSKDNPDAPVGLAGFRKILDAVRARALKIPV